ncbi:Secreted frizzled-related protein 5 [Toxocara canis]|uniref:Secreted frizzled-related protein 5 n=1 Tax=Toxocara canis TaxID=6265 RepID=A0A0B2V2J0_TOXCA|nr:Secreted frizzled-related protein 5 [Toxocara canis]
MASANMFLLLLLHVVLLTLVVHSAYISESWAMLTSDRPSAPKCVEIPRNLTLCYGIQYSTMRLPNLLEHETVDEVIEQAAPWIPLHRLNCHPDTQLFLCSLFAPVCLATLDREILPCRSLCTAVQQGCEGRMRQYGFPWPEMLSCKKYPTDNDMCIGAVSEKSSSLNHTCPSCSQVGTYENILDHYCRSQIVLKARIGTVNESHVKVRKARSLKRLDRKRSVVRDTIIHFSADRGCPCPVNGSSDARFLIMADQNEKGDFIANLILPWNNTDKPFKKAIRSFRKLNCQSLGREIRESAYRMSARRSAH